MWVTTGVRWSGMTTTSRPFSSVKWLICGPDDASTAVGTAAGLETTRNRARKMRGSAWGTTDHGEGLASPNFRGRLYQHYDGAGVLTNATYDFEGRIIHATRQLAATYRSTPKWDTLANLTDPNEFLPSAAAAGLIETDIFDTWTTYDAMSQTISITTHDRTVLKLDYNAASLLGSVTAFMRGGERPQLPSCQKLTTTPAVND
jgi:YD repeat-containing protein